MKCEKRGNRRLDVNGFQPMGIKDHWHEGAKAGGDSNFADAGGRNKLRLATFLWGFLWGQKKSVCLTLWSNWSE